MQKRSSLILPALAAVLCLCFIQLPISATQDTVKINDLVENASFYDGKTVAVTAEAIGECMERGSDAWINVNDGSNAIGIWMTREESSQITYYGDYRYTGDTIAVTGIYNRACKEHGGEPDIHCKNITVIKAGKIRSEEISSDKILAAIFFTVSGSMLFVGLKTGNRKNRTGINR
jgi:hypothetical protein